MMGGIAHLAEYILEVLPSVTIGTCQRRHVQLLLHDSSLVIPWRFLDVTQRDLTTCSLVGIS